MDRIFILSPANCNGKRAQYLLNPQARFDLGARMADGHAVPLADAFSFMSGLYFRGKWEYAQAFGSQLAEPTAAYVITSNRGLMHAAASVGRQDLLDLREGHIHLDNVDYTLPLKRDADARAVRWPGEVVLLGSIATQKYADILLGAFGSRLLFPVQFAGRGDLSRGGLLLRSVRSGIELEYSPVQVGLRHGPRPPRLSKWQK